MTVQTNANDRNDAVVTHLSSDRSGHEARHDEVVSALVGPADSPQPASGRTMPTLLTVDEVAGVLCVSVARAYELARMGVLPTVRLGRQVRVNKARFIEWIDAGGAALPGGWRAKP